MDTLTRQIAALLPGSEVCAGHGEVATADELSEFRDYLADLRSRVQTAINEGQSFEQAKERLKLPVKYKGFAFQNFATPNVEDVFKEFSGIKK